MRKRYLLVGLFLLLPSLAFASVSFGRDALKGTTKTQGDFNLSHKFTVEIDGVVIGGIHEIDGLETETDVVDYQDGEDRTLHTRPGNHKPGKITITKDFSPDDRMFFNWRKEVLDGKVDRKSISIIFQNDAGEESERVHLFGCHPTKWKGPSLNAKNSGHATEVIEIQCENIVFK